MRAKTDPILVIGFGNPGRGDDGLGPAFAARVEELAIEGVHVEASYQLSVEDAAILAEHEMVLFADATRVGPEPFHLEPLRPLYSTGFTTHHLQPSAVVAIARELFDAELDAYVVAIRGYEFDRFEESLSAAAEANLRAALDFVVPALRRGPLRKELPKAGNGSGLVLSLETRSSHA
jgi:hydrogenase maturation protease